MALQSFQRAPLSPCAASDRGSYVQGHAAWHILSASALVFEFVHVVAAVEQGCSAGQKFRGSGTLSMGHLSP